MSFFVLFLEGGKGKRRVVWVWSTPREEKAWFMKMGS